MSNENPQNSLSILTCPSCNGRGRLGVRPCASCHGHGLYLWSLGYLFYWGKKINKQEIWQTKINKTLKIIFYIILFIITFWGLLSLASFLLDLVNYSFLWNGLFSTKDPRLFNFWFSVIVDLYLFYRLSKKLTAEEQVIAKSRTVGEIRESRLPEQLNWDNISRVSKKLRLDISKSFSPQTLDCVKKSWQVAMNLKHREIEPLHLLAASLTFKETANIFGRLGISLNDLKTKISSAAITFFSDKKGLTQPEISLNLKKIFFRAYAIAQTKRKTQVDLFDLLIALNEFESPTREVLYALDIEKDELKNVVLWVETSHQLAKSVKRFGFLSTFKPKTGMNRAMTAIATPILDRLGSDLTLLARNDYLTPCVARDAELDQIFKIVEAQKHGVLLIGNPGTGRSTIVGGIARRMVTEKVPKILQDKRLVKLSLAALVSGAAESGTTEARISTAINEIVKSGNISISIKDIHNMIGIKTTAGELDVSEILANAISSGRFFVIATTTPTDYKRHLEGSALDEVLEKVKIAEPKGNQVIQILEVKSMPLEHKHEVFFSYDAIAAAAKLSDRYLHDRYLPEKAITILEEAAIQVHRQRGRNSIIQKQDIAAIISKKTKIPLTQITEQESAKLVHLEERIHEKMIDQDPAVTAIARALRRARAQLRDTGRPIASFLFLGPTGVGKTQLAKVVAQVYFGSAKNMIRLDMSEYQDETSITRLIGSPQTKAGGYLTEAVRQNPFSLILLDELEKAHPDILNLFLQVMDDGRLTDGLGRTIDFTNTIIIGTSNAGAQYIYEAIKRGDPYEKIKRNLIEEQIKTHYRPEFLNRLDEIIVFKPLNQSEINQIAVILLAEVVAQMETKGIKLEITEPAVIELAKVGFDPEFGARPLRRVIQERVTNALANYIIQGDVDRRDTVIYDVGGKIRIEKARKL